MRLIFLLALSTSVMSAQGRLYSFKQIDILLDSLSEFAESYPPNVRNEDQLGKVRTFFAALESQLAGMEKDLGSNPELELRLGTLFRYGHNLDIQNAWKNSELHLRKAISLDANNADAYDELGLLYVNSDMSRAAEAEQLFKKAIEVSPNHQNPSVHIHLAFAYYYQGQPEKAIQELDGYLKDIPDDQEAIDLKKTIKAAKERAK